MSYKDIFLGLNFPVATSQFFRWTIFVKIKFTNYDKSETKKLFGIVVIMSTALLFSCGEELSIDEPGNLVPKTVTQDTSLPTIYANGAWLHSEAFGPEDGTMIIAIHGGGREITAISLTAKI
ncbi:hypothetical protein H9W95_19015 [Flavobacterium lindanitolerans]|nr:hypothetical protein [Flavobacterium lindanitolerans]